MSLWEIFLCGKESGEEMRCAVECHRHGEMLLIGVMVSDCIFEEAPLRDIADCAARRFAGGAPPQSQPGLESSGG